MLALPSCVMTRFLSLLASKAPAARSSLGTTAQDASEEF